MLEAATQKRGLPIAKPHNDLAQRLSLYGRPGASELRQGLVPSPPSSASGRCMPRAIGELPEDEREVFDLVCIQGMTQEAAAQLTCIVSPGGVTMSDLEQMILERHSTRLFCHNRCRGSC